jgi:hypothetical protein
MVMHSVAAIALLFVLVGVLYHPKNISGIWGFQYFLCLIV